MDTITIGITPLVSGEGKKLLQINNDIPIIFQNDQWLNFESIKDLTGAEVKLCTLSNGVIDRCLGTFKLKHIGLGKRWVDRWTKKDVLCDCYLDTSIDRLLDTDFIIDLHLLPACYYDPLSKKIKTYLDSIIKKLADNISNFKFGTECFIEINGYLQAVVNADSAFDSINSWGRYQKINIRGFGNSADVDKFVDMIYWYCHEEENHVKEFEEDPAKQEHVTFVLKDVREQINNNRRNIQFLKECVKKFKELGINEGVK